MEEKLLREKAREAIQARKLPRYRPKHIWGGQGNGDVCALCGQPFQREQTGFDLEFVEDTGKVSYPMHLRCFSAWDQEREELAAGRPGG